MREPLTLQRVNELIQQRFGIAYKRTRLIAFLHEAAFRPRARAGWVKLINGPANRY